MCGTRPQYSWITISPGPLPDLGTARCPFVVRPSHGNSTSIDGPRLPAKPSNLRRGGEVRDDEVPRRAVVASAHVVAVGLPERAALDRLGVERVDLRRLLDDEQPR